ncbi:hypothetical protein B0H11DRAFT_1926660 [Mycena galericulata]|nr:hypothetical protein B0H11DRAFT_1926660 [Mycena galericulata]
MATYIDGPLPLLRTLKLTTAPQSASAYIAPLLRRVFLHYYDNPSLHPILPWSQLTVLTVGSIQPELCAEILDATTNLLYCKFRLGVIGPETPNLRDIAVPHLKSLTVSAPGDLLRAFLPTLMVPALCRLSVTWWDPIQAIPTLVSLVSRSGCTLEELCIVGSLFPPPKQSYPTALPSVASFRFKRAPDPNKQEKILLKDADSDDESDSDEYEYPEPRSEK